MTFAIHNGFPSCRHAGTAVGNGVRQCTSPKLIGLKAVTPELCSDCYCRDHADAPPADGQSEARLVPCLYRGDRTDPPAPQSDWRLAFGVRQLAIDSPHDAVQSSIDNHQSSLPTSDSQHTCRHPQHDWASPSRCARCSDYAFPVLSPRMPIPEVLAILKESPRSQPDDWWEWDNVQEAQRLLADEAARSIGRYPGGYAGRGIVLVGGGAYFASAYVTAAVIRHVGCRLPIELWHLPGEMTVRERLAIADFNVACIDAGEVAQSHPFRFIPDHWWRGWQLKVYAVLHSSFREVLLLDADCYPVRDPTFLFDWKSYRDKGAVFWPDIAQSSGLLTESKLAAFGADPFPDAPTESGQLLVHKEHCWKELNLAAHYNAQADFTYRILWGDKDTFPVAWRRLGREYGRMWPESTGIPQGILQYDDRGQVLFLHRCTAKFTLEPAVFHSTPGQLVKLQCNAALPHEQFCHQALAGLREQAPPHAENAPGDQPCAWPDPLTQLAKQHGTDKWGWHSYTPLYHEWFGGLREQALHVLELGVSQGASLRMWRDYFPSAQITGVDRTLPAKPLGPRIRFHQADLDCPDHYAPFTGLDVTYHLIVDDASHAVRQQLLALLLLWPCLAPGGWYIIEDVVHLANYVQQLQRTFGNVEIYDRRGLHNEIDDVLVVIRKKGQI